MKQEYTFTAYTEDQMGLLNKITIILSRRKISIKSLNISTCEIDKMYRCTLVIEETFEIARNIALQIEKIIEVFKCYCSTNEEIIWKQMGLFKVITSSFINEENMNHLLRKQSVRFITIEKDFIVFEATGQEEELDNLAAELRNFGLIEFIKTARIAVVNNSNAFDIY
ncbi:acetolactate synthase small subunit [Flavobacterium johnsoniae]|uniref:Acetolactate synthase small subunit n=1 Tax=Flavobacterium johnsoniae TaxID=986 RepID=A0A1M5VD74_FLAJO|nr:acetolactate synthase small subunit [Flavobacterium johnsoniae]SHH73177.1 acetolactate synthase, small subunit [Flavobacterium johnsoniae]